MIPRGRIRARRAKEGAMVSRRWWWVLVVVGLVLPGLPVRAAPAGTTLTLGVDQEVVGLDPNLVTAFSSFRRVDFLYNKLVRYNDRLEIEPDLAESWEYQDPRTITFHLRRGVKFHDGTEMTSRSEERRVGKECRAGGTPR